MHRTIDHRRRLVDSTTVIVDDWSTRRLVDSTTGRLDVVDGRAEKIIAQRR
jgi:hypothetical protein